jgi:hypothetical protein
LKRGIEPLTVIGWREWVSLPGLGIAGIKAKVDTGARTSALHAYDIHRFRRRGQSMVRFKVHPLQRNTAQTVEAEAPVLDRRSVRSSGGHEQERIVIVTPLLLLGRTWEIELTLASRDAMGFRMLLGRQALRGHLVVDPGRSYLGGRPPGTRRARFRGESDR